MQIYGLTFELTIHLTIFNTSETRKAECFQKDLGIYSQIQLKKKLSCCVVAYVLFKNILFFLYVYNEHNAKNSLIKNQAILVDYLIG